MNIHEHQAKKILKNYGAKVPKGIFAFKVQELLEKAKTLKTEKYVLKAQIHSGGRGKAGGVKLVNNLNDLENEAKNLIGKILVTHQTGPNGRKVKRLYVEEASAINKEFYLSCLVDRESSKIAFISSDQGGMDIEEVANKNPEKILTTKVEFSDQISEDDCKKILGIFNLGQEANEEAIKLIKSIYKMFLSTDAGLVEINPLILTKDKKVICLDAKINFDDNSLYRHPEILKLRDLNEENPTEVEASKNNLAYIKLDGSIGCMVNGAGLAMGTMDIVALHGGFPANFLDVGGGATKERVAEAFKIILSDDRVQAILVNIFGGIVRCDLIAEGIIAAVKEVGVEVPVVVRLEGTNADLGSKILAESGLDIIAATSLTHAAQSVVAAAGGDA